MNDALSTIKALVAAGACVFDGDSIHSMGAQGVDDQDVFAAIAAATSCEIRVSDVHILRGDAWFAVCVFVRDNVIVLGVIDES